MPTPAEIIAKKNMIKHPEGGYYVETYRSPDNVTFTKGTETVTRAASTGIEFLLQNDDKSHLHMLDIDEQWTFAGGAPILLQFIDPATGQWQAIKLGNPFEHEDVTATAFIKKGTWFCAGLAPDSGAENPAGLVSCVCSPAFDFKESFRLANEEDKASILKTHPELAEKLDQFVLKPKFEASVGASSQTIGGQNTKKLEAKARTAEEEAEAARKAAELAKQQQKQKVAL